MNDKYIPIETDRLILRDFSLNDWNDIFYYQNNPGYLRYYPWKSRSREDVIELINRFTSWSQESPRCKFQLAITLKDKNNLIGNCGIRKNNDATCEAELGCELNPEYWGSGYAYEAIKAILDFGFNKLNLHRIWSQCIAKNNAAIELTKKLNMREEGRLLKQQWLHDKWEDVLVHAMLKDEWKQ